MRIIIDAMGGDNAPVEIIKGAAQAADEYGVEFIFVGDQEIITQIANDISFDLTPHKIVHTDVVITMDDDPIVVLHAKKESSLCVGLRMLAAGEGDAFVSATNTGALFTAASLIVRKIPGIQRAAIGSVLPMKPPVLLLDSGANITVTEDYMEQFAVMGSAYVKSVHNIERPRVGLLNNGSEPSKGTQLQIDTYARLANNEYINFVGNVESNLVPFDVCDVLVADGFSGNILLKTVEGMIWTLVGEEKRIWLTNNKAYNQYRFENISSGSDTECSWRLTALWLYNDASNIAVPALEYPTVDVMKDIELAEISQEKKTDNIQEAKMEDVKEVTEAIIKTDVDTNIDNVNNLHLTSISYFLNHFFPLFPLE